MAKHYSVFLSYRHRPFDAAVTQRVFNVLESYRLPWTLRHKGYTGVRRAFRDTEELPVSRMLTSTIQTALQNSDCLVVVCSPDTPASEWVDREVATFIELGKADHIFPLLIAGTPETTFPASLKKVPDVMNRLMDLREHAKTVSASDPGALLRVIAAVAGCAPAQLVRADRMRRSRRNAARATLSVAVGVAIVSIAAVFWLQAENYRATALREQERSLQVLSLLTYDLPGKLVELPNTYTAVAKILDENAEQINRILALAEEQDGIREQIAANYEKHATASVRLGRYETAAQSEQKAIALYEALRLEGTPGADASLASAHNNLGVVYNAAGAYAEAAAEYTAAVELLEPIYADTPSFTADLASFLSNSGANAMDLGDYASAVPALSRSIELLSAFPSGSSGAHLASLARSRYNLGLSLTATGEYAEAESHLRTAAEYYEAQYEALKNRSNLKPYAQALSQLAYCLSSQAKLDEAAELFPTAVSLLETLAEGGDDATATLLLASACNNYGLCLNMQGDYAAAAPWCLRYAELREGLYKSSKTDLNRAGLARAYYNIAENAFKEGDYATVRTYFKKCLTEYEPVSRKLGDYHAAEYLARLSYYNIIVTQNYKKALTAAKEAAELQPESSFVQANYVYALLYNQQYDACDTLAAELVSRSDGELRNIELDFAALTAAGLHEPHMDALLKQLRG